MNLYAATSNPGKLREFTLSAAQQNIGARSPRIHVLPLPNLAALLEPVEDAPTFIGNAELKARAYSLTLPGALVFADDSGLEVPALDNQPGVRSARYADDAGFTELPNTVISTEPRESAANRGGSGEIPAFAPAPANGFPSTKDERNNALLLQRLGENPNRPQFGRQARFICAIALARDGQILLRSEGTVQGEILHAPRGSSGFGYDPLFLIPALGLTFAELDPAQKWQLSHRGRAFRALLAQLSTLNVSS